MLARRFTIICLLTSLFGMMFAILVAETGRHDRSAGYAKGCFFDRSIPCHSTATN